MKIYLKYIFIFDPSDIWQSHEGFNDDLGKYFDSRGYLAELVDSGMEKPQEIIVYLERKPETIIQTQPVTPIPEKSIKQTFSNFVKGRDFQGKFKKKNG